MQSKVTKNGAREEEIVAVEGTDPDHGILYDLLREHIYAMEDSSEQEDSSCGTEPQLTQFTQLTQLHGIGTGKTGAALIIAEDLLARGSLGVPDIHGPYWHTRPVEQVMGTCVRMADHSDLPEKCEERT